MPVTVTPDLLAGFLKRTDLFGRFSQEELRRVLPLFRVVKVEAGRAVFDEGEKSDAWYVVLDGEVSVVKDMGEAPSHELAHLGAGECFGEMGLLDGAPRMASVTAETDTLLAGLPRSAFQKLVANGDPAAARLLWSIATVLAQRQRELTTVLLDLVDTNTTEDRAEMEQLAKLLRATASWQ